MGLFSSIAGFFGAGQQKKAAGQASAAQVAAAQKGIDQIGAQNALTQSQLSPYIGAGTDALNSIRALLGLGAPTGGATTGAANFSPIAQLLQERPDVVAEYDRLAATADPNSPWFAEHGLDQGVEGFGKWWAQKNGVAMPTAPTSTPTLAGGQTAQEQQAAAIEALKGSPLYQMIYGAGEEAVLQNAAATGGLRGGNTQRSLADFGADTLAQVIQQQLANLGGLSTQGVNTALGGGQLGANASTNIANLLGEQGAARAGGILGKANAANAQLGYAGQGLEALLGSFDQGSGGKSGGDSGGILKTIASLF